LNTQVSTRADIITRRTYSRPLIDGVGEKFESWDDTCQRVIGHQGWLWERALTHKAYPEVPLHDLSEDMKEWVQLNEKQTEELTELYRLMYERKIMPAGRTLWLGGTEVSRRRESSMFNCSHTNIETVYDVVDAFWLLLQGCGVGFTPVVGTLTGFRKPIPEIEVIRSTRKGKGGRETNEETFDENGVWTISVGDSAEAWAKSIGKLIAGKYEARKLVFDFSEIRPAGERLKGYGWISSGDDSISVAYPAIARILSRRSGALLTKLDILDILNWLGTVLSSRRSAEIALCEYGSAEWYEFATAKERCYEPDFVHRQQSNNSLVFYRKPAREELEELFDLIVRHGGSEPGLVNGQAALKRAPWFKGLNPCAEILLSNKSFCNLVEVDVAKFYGDSSGLHRAISLAARMNYRQTVVDFRDGILQESWHLNNEFLRLCGVGVTGIVQREDLSEFDWKSLKYSAVTAARSMAKELNLQHPKNVTTVKPSGTVSKIMDTTEGIHKPLGHYIFNWVNFSKSDPLVNALRNANYRVIDNPSDPTGCIVCLPVKWSHIDFDTIYKPLSLDDDAELVECEVNLEPATAQLDRYLKVQNFYVDHNVSNTISYDKDEVPQIIDWLLENWDSYVAVSFLFRADPTKNARDLGYAYLPQEVVTKDEYNRYVDHLLQVNFDHTESFEELEQDDCATGACPIK
jgi:adenosylcobalamin-dependent ribonucleoside-triphosphate reductase